MITNSLPFPKPASNGGNVTTTHLNNAIATEATNRNAAILVEKNRAIAVENSTLNFVINLASKNSEGYATVTVPANRPITNPFESGIELPTNYMFRCELETSQVLAGEDRLLLAQNAHVGRNLENNIALFINNSGSTLTLNFWWKGTEV